MTEYALLRARESLREMMEYPAESVLPPGHPADGLCFLAEHESDVAVVASLREHVARIWRVTRLGEVDRKMLVVVFIRPQRIAMEDAPRSLRLKRTGQAEWSSFSLRGDEASSLARDVPPIRGSARLWWNGAPEIIQLDERNATPIEALWPTAEVIVHRARAHKPLLKSADQKRSPADPDTSVTDADRSKPPILRAPFSSAAGDFASIVDQTERDLASRSRGGILRAIGRDLGRLLPFRGGASHSGKSAGHGGASTEPGAMSRLLGWVRWHTPFGSQLQGEVARRTSLIEKLIRSGAIDEALKLAFKLGNDNGSGREKKLFPTRLPGARGSLEFSIDRSRYVAPILGSTDLYKLRSRYADAAKALAARGDYRRAAYIRSQLLGDHLLAVKTLEEGGLLAEAAKLAHDSGQHPFLVIRLLFKLGQLDAALALAKRTGHFERLAADSVATPSFRAFVLKAWTDQLVATGQFARALAVTDGSVMAATTKNEAQDLITARRLWLMRVLETRPDNTFEAEATVRALLTARWTADDIPVQTLHDFPMRRPSAGREPFVGCLADLRATMHAPADESKPALLSVLRALAVHAKSGSEEQTAFWNGPARRLLDPLARAIIEKCSDGLRREDLDDIRSLLTRASLPVLAEDLRKLRSIYRNPTAPDNVRVQPPDSEGSRAEIISAGILAGGQVMVSRLSGEFELLGRRGEMLWTGWLENVVAIIPIAESSDALIVQQDRLNGPKLLRFSTVDRSVVPIGSVDLVAWHDITSEGQWLVQIDGEVGALDLAELAAPTPRIVFLWSVQITRRLVARAFFHDSVSPCWVTTDVSQERFGCQEVWKLLQGRNLQTQLLTGADHHNYHKMQVGDAWEPLPYGHWSFGKLNDTCLLSSLHQPTAAKQMHLLDWSDPHERTARRLQTRRDGATPGGQDRFQSVDFERPQVFDPVRHTGYSSFLVRASSATSGFSLESDIDISLSLLARAPVRSADGTQSQVVLLTDPFGRLHRLDASRRVVDTFA